MLDERGVKADGTGGKQEQEPLSVDPANDNPTGTAREAISWSGSKKSGSIATPHQRIHLVAPYKALYATS